MIKMIIYKDKASNTLSYDLDGRLAVRNREGKLVNPEQSKRFLRQKLVRMAIKKRLGYVPKLKIKSKRRKKI